MEVMPERVAGLDVHKAMIVACVRLMAGGKVSRECRTFDTTTSGLLALRAWLGESGCTQVAMEATGEKRVTHGNDGYPQVQAVKE